MFIQVTRKLPINVYRVPCTVNADHIEWVQPSDDGGATIYMEAGPEIEAAETYESVITMLRVDE